MNHISISAIIPAYNAEGTVSRALDSVLAQTRLPEEILIVDDCSGDATAIVAGTYADRGVKTLRLRNRSGAAAARNAGIRAARGSWIAFLDADDEWLPGKIEKQATAIANRPQVSLVFCGSEEFSPEGHSLGDTFRGAPVVVGDEAWKALLAYNFVSTPTVLAPRKLLLELGGFDERLKVAEDQDMWVRLALAGPLAYVPDPLVRVHVQPNSLSSWSPEDQTDYTLPMIERHLTALSEQLAADEVRRIRGARLQNAGLINCAHGDLRGGVPPLLRSAFLGYRPARAVRAIVGALVRTGLTRAAHWTQVGAPRL